MLIRNWFMILYLKVIQGIIFGGHYLSLWILNMLLLCVLALMLAVEKFDAKLIFFSLKLTLSFCLNTERVFFSFFLLSFIVLLEHVSALTIPGWFSQVHSVSYKYMVQVFFYFRECFWIIGFFKSIFSVPLLWFSFFLCICWFFFTCLLYLSFFS